jgi:hypothetical protein
MKKHLIDSSFVLVSFSAFPAHGWSRSLDHEEAPNRGFLPPGAAGIIRLANVQPSTTVPSASRPWISRSIGGTCAMCRPALGLSSTASFRKIQRTRSLACCPHSGAHLDQPFKPCNSASSSLHHTTTGASPILFHHHLPSSLETSPSCLELKASSHLRHTPWRGSQSSKPKPPHSRRDLTPNSPPKPPAQSPN